MSSSENDLYEDKVSDPRNLEMRRASGRVNDPRPIVGFLYLLVRDHLPIGTVEQLIRDSALSDGDESEFTNGWVANYAQHGADRLGVER